MGGSAALILTETAQPQPALSDAASALNAARQFNADVSYAPVWKLPLSGPGEPDGMEPASGGHAIYAGRRDGD
jgi:hypothetical protein